MTACCARNTYAGSNREDGSCNRKRQHTAGRLVSARTCILTLESQRVSDDVALVGVGSASRWEEAVSRAYESRKLDVTGKEKAGAQLVAQTFVWRFSNVISRCTRDAWGHDATWTLTFLSLPMNDSECVTWSLHTVPRVELSWV